MGFIEKSLLPNENVIHRAKTSGMALIVPVGIFVSACLCYFPASSDAMLGCIMFYVALILGAVMLYPLSLYSNTEFAVTNQRIMATTRVLRRNTLELQLKQIESVRANQDILGRTFNYGTIVLTGSGGTSGKFPMISDPMNLIEKINVQIAEAS